MLDFFFSIRGRVPRRTWWAWKAILVLASIGMVFLFRKGPPIATWLFCPLYGFAVWFSLALDIKRFHDRDKSGWWIFIRFIPVVGSLWALVELGFLPGTPWNNRFGRRPSLE